MKKRRTHFNSEQVYIKDWLNFHPYNRSNAVDNYYLGLSKEVYGIIHSNNLLFNPISIETERKTQLACFLTCWFEDVISETGIWKTFIEEHFRMYGKYLPFYKTVDYFPLEINREDIYFLIWYFLSNVFFDDELVSPESKWITVLGDDALKYEISDTYIFNKVTPLLALKPKDWLAGIQGEGHALYNAVKEMDSKKTGNYLFLKEDDNYLYFKHLATDTIIPATKKSIEKGPEFREEKTIVVIGFVKWNGEWWFSGVYSDFDYSDELILNEKKSAKSKMIRKLNIYMYEE